MAKEPYELFPHQYAELLQKDIPFTIKGELSRTFRINPEHGIYTDASEILQGKTPRSAKYKSRFDKYENRLADARKKANQIAFEHARLVYQAEKSGIKINNKIKRAIPDLYVWARAYNWDDLPDIEVKSTHGNKKPYKPEPTREIEDEILDPLIEEDKKLGDWY